MDVKATVQKLIAAPSCCPEAKAAGEAYLAAYGTPKQAEAAKALVAELKDDVCSIEGFIDLTASDMGKKIFGDKAGAMNEAGKKAKEAGGKYCLCDACQAGGELLDHADEL